MAKTRISLDLHDFSVECTNMFYLMQLREHYPKIKISMFFVPADAQNYNTLIDTMREKSRDLIKQAVLDGWIELIPHGISHIHGEFHNASYKDMELALAAYDELFTEWEVPFIRGFCAPNWLISEAAVACLNDHGYWLAIDRNQPDCLKAKRNYVYNWDIADPFPRHQGLVKGHGHISLPSRNNLRDSLHNLLHMPTDAEFVFVSEIMKKGKKSHGN